MSDDSFTSRMRQPDNDKPTPSEIRTRREIRAMAYPLFAVLFIVFGSASDVFWVWAIHAVFALLCLAQWQSARPALPGDDPPLFKSVKATPWLFALVAASAVTLAIGSVQTVLHPERWWAWLLLAVGVALTALLAVLLVVGRRNYERARETP